MFGSSWLWKCFSWSREVTVVADDGSTVRPRGLPRVLDDARSTAWRRHRLHWLCSTRNVKDPSLLAVDRGADQGTWARHPSRQGCGDRARYAQEHEDNE